MSLRFIRRGDETKWFYYSLSPIVTHSDQKAEASSCRGRWLRGRCRRSRPRRRPGARYPLWSGNCTCPCAPTLSKARSPAAPGGRARGAHIRCDRRPCRSRAATSRTRPPRDTRRICQSPIFPSGPLRPWPHRSWSRSGTQSCKSRLSRRRWTRRPATGPTTRPRRATSTRPASRSWLDGWWGPPSWTPI